jgi:DNA-binding CsgD family transcriptional regulator
LSHKERWVLISILSAVFLLVAADIIGDSKEGVDFWHLVLEGSVGLISLFGIFYVLRDSFKTRKNLIETNQKFSTYREESEKWRAESKKYLEGLSSAIDEQLCKWGLTAAEKDVTFLLLKGLSLKEVANARNTSEKTARAQSMAVYAKAGLSSRSELSAFFLEDLLVPLNSSNR